MFEAHGVPVLAGIVAETVDEARAAAVTIGASSGGVVVVKAQVKVGGRGKAGGVKVAKSADEAAEAAEAILGMDIKGHTVREVMIAAGAQIEQEYYFSVLLDRANRSYLAMASKDGGVEIEVLAVERPEALARIPVDPIIGIDAAKAREIVEAANFDEDVKDQIAEAIQKLWTVYRDEDATLVEVNPLVKTTDGRIVALDGKVTLDDNADFRHKEWEEMRDLSAEEPTEVEAKAAGLTYIKLAGNVGCVVNGAGLAMATMDLIKRYGGEPANFLDVGGSSSPEKMVTAMRIILSDPNVKTILINIFGGITRCDDIANGLLAAQKQADIRVPLVARLTGTNAEKAREILKGSAVTPAETMADAVKKAVALASGKK